MCSMSSSQWQPKDTRRMISCRGKKDEHDDDHTDNYNDKDVGDDDDDAVS